MDMPNRIDAEEFGSNKEKKARKMDFEWRT